MQYNKVIFYGKVLVDLTKLTVTPETLAEGVIAIDATGKIIVGTAKISNAATAELGEAKIGTMKLGVDN